MSTHSLAWYTSGMFLLLAFLASLISYAPSPANWEDVLPATFAGGALLMATLAVVIGRLPSTHWVHQSRPVSVGLTTLAVLTTLLAVLVI